MNAQSRKDAGCGHNAAAMTLDSALEAVLGAVGVVDGTEDVALMDALGRVLAQDVHAAADVPGHTNSAMDGYAFRHADLGSSPTSTLRVVGESFAGRPYRGEPGAGECVRIMTGAAVPASTDTVVMQEDVQRRDDCIELPSKLPKGEHVRLAGEDIRHGDRVLSSGRLLRPADLGLLASVGVERIQARRRVKVAYFSTGDELRAVGEALEYGEIHDSNRYTLHGMLTQAGVETVDLGVVRDELPALRRAFEEAAASADVVLTSGGASVGEADYITDVLAELGEVAFWHIAVKPGRPLIFGRVGDAAFFGLPGNPVSVMVTFLQVVRPALAALSGQAYSPPLRLPARTTHRLHKKPGRMEFQRGIVTTTENGELSVSSTGHQGSGILRSMSEANCFIVLDLDSGPVEAGEVVWIEPFQP